MGGKIPVDDMSTDRLEALAEVQKLIQNPPRTMSTYRNLLPTVYHLLEKCPSIECGYCSFMPRAEEAKHAVLPT